MKAILHLYGVLALSFHCAAAPPSINQPGGFRLTVELADGSRVVGESGDEVYQFKSEILGAMKLPLERIRTIESQAGTDSVKLTTASGDILTAQFVMKEIRVDTTFGRVKLAVNSIKRMQVAAAGKPGSIRPGMVALWSGERNANDLVGGNHGMLMNGAGFADGKVGNAFHFGGGNQCVEIPYSESLIPPNYSVEAWIKPMAQVSSPDNQAVIFGESYGFPLLLVRPGTTGVQVVAQFGTSSSTFYEAASTSEIPIGQFSHLFETWDGTTLRLYINGILTAQNTPGATPAASACSFYLGGFFHPDADNCQTISQFFNGLIDEVAIYNHALSASEIQAMGKDEPRGDPPPSPTHSPQRLPFRGQPAGLGLD